MIFGRRNRFQIQKTDSEDKLQIQTQIALPDTVAEYGSRYSFGVRNTDTSTATDSGTDNRHGLGWQPQRKICGRSFSRQIQTTESDYRFGVRMTDDGHGHGHG